MRSFELSTARKALDAAKRVKDDEFYTRIEDIEKELAFYPGAFEGKKVYCPCDSPESAFVQFFRDHFDELGLERLTWSSLGGSCGMLTRNGLVEWPIPDGRFQSADSTSLLAECDVVVTNPPFSLFREFFDWLTASGKGFIVLCNQNAITYKNVFPRILAGEAWLGANQGEMKFRVPADSEPRVNRYWVDETGQKWRSLGNGCWLTNIDHTRRHETIPLTATYDPAKYPRYDNYDAVNVDRVKDIPNDYEGVMGVPITFLDKWNPEQFEIVDANLLSQGVAVKPHGLIKDKDSAINGKPKYVRIAIRRVIVS